MLYSELAQLFVKQRKIPTANHSLWIENDSISSIHEKYIMSQVALMYDKMNRLANINNITMEKNPKLHF